MRFKQFLEAKIQNYEHEPKIGDDLIKTLREHCGKALESGGADNFIYRGSRSSLKAGVYNPGAGERKSQNTSNFYTMFLDTNSLNDDFPKRSKSFIASSSLSKADGYAHSYNSEGTLVYCFPFNETKVALVNSDDMWDLRIGLDALFSTTSIVELNDFWEDLLGDMMIRKSEIKSLGDMISAIQNEHPETVVNRLKKEGLLHGVDMNKITNEAVVKRFVNALPRAYSYKQLGCTLTTPDDLPSENTEVWFSGKCVMVPEHMMRALKEEFGW